jgi:hypothetical protein
MWHHVTNHLITSNDKDSNSENRIKLRVHDNYLVSSVVCSFEILYHSVLVVYFVEPLQHPLYILSSAYFVESLHFIPLWLEYFVESLPSSLLQCLTRTLPLCVIHRSVVRASL